MPAARRRCRSRAQRLHHAVHAAGRRVLLGFVHPGGTVFELTAKSLTANACRLLALLALPAASGCIVVETHKITEMPIAAARGQAPGTAVTIEGVVTVASGTIGDGFALQDASGGIYITRAFGRPAKLGDRMLVSGKLAAPDKQVAVEPGLVELLGTGAASAPQEIRTGFAGPATEGRLIAVRGKIIREVENDPPWGWKIISMTDRDRCWSSFQPKQKSTSAVCARPVTAHRRLQRTL